MRMGPRAPRRIGKRPACHENPAVNPVEPSEGVRLDKWLWAARFFKTRSLATEEIGKGRVSVNGHPAKPSREVRIGDTIELRPSALARTVIVAGVSHMRGPAPMAQALYRETAESIAAREAALAARS